MEFTEFIKSILLTASALALHNFGGIQASTIKTGDNNQVLTKTDLAVGSLIVSKIQSQFPTHNIIDEEAGIIDHNSEFTWVVDPIDGTANFAQGVPTYGILLGLLRDGKPYSGGLALPSFDSLYLATKNQGSTLNNKKISVSQSTQLSRALISYGIDGHQENPNLTSRECLLLSDIILKIRNLRTTNSAYDFGLVADGRYGAYLNQTSKIWDNVAAQIIIEEAGGVYTDFYGKPMDYSNPITKANQNFTYCAASPSLHQQLQDIIQSHTQAPG